MSAGQRLRPGFRPHARRAAAGHRRRLPRQRCPPAAPRQRAWRFARRAIEYLRSKGVGERALLAADRPGGDHVRPSIVSARRTIPQPLCRVHPLAAGVRGACPQAMFQPVYVGDVARALHFALDEPRRPARSRALRAEHLHDEGPDRVRVRGHRRLHDRRPARALVLYAGVDAEHLPQLMTRDNSRSMQVPSTCSTPFPLDLLPRPPRLSFRLSGADRAAQKCSAASLARAALGP